MVKVLTMAIRAIVEASCLRTRRLKGDLGTREWNYNCVCKKEPRRGTPVQVLRAENVGEGLHKSYVLDTCVFFRLTFVFR